MPGIPGIPGQHGRDGLPGLRGNDGAKGEPGVKWEPGELKGNHSCDGQAQSLAHANWKQCAWRKHYETDKGFIRVRMTSLTS